MTDLFKAIVGRVVAAGVAAGAGFIAVKTGVAIGVECQQQIAEVAVGGIMLASYGITHKVLPPARK